jgi:hypothetical protein
LLEHEVDDAHKLSGQTLCVIYTGTLDYEHLCGTNHQLQPVESREELLRDEDRRDTLFERFLATLARRVTPAHSGKLTTGALQIGSRRMMCQWASCDLSKRTIRSSIVVHTAAKVGTAQEDAIEKALFEYNLQRPGAMC